MRLRKTFPRDLFFNDVLLPRWAHSLDVLAMLVLPDTPEDTADWFFRFTICTGRVRRSPVYAVRRHCTRLLRQLTKRRSEVLTRIPSSTTIRVSPSLVYRDWLESLRQMLALTKGRKSCSWYADSHPSDPYWPCDYPYISKLKGRGYVFASVKA
jgi:hypothetical protein